MVYNYSGKEFISTMTCRTVLKSRLILIILTAYNIYVVNFSTECVRRQFTVHCIYYK